MTVNADEGISAIIQRSVLRLILAGTLGVAGATGDAAASSMNPWSGDQSPSGSIESFRKWTNVLDNHPPDMALLDGPCDASQFNACHLRGWVDFVSSIEGLSQHDQLDRVNAYFNQSPYITDLVNWGMPDYWARPLQFLDRSGDCEDYAIIKYYSLVKLGFSRDQLRIIVLHDNNLNVGHAVLAVRLSGQTIILDNQIDALAPPEMMPHYSPIFSINESHWWRHS